MDEPRVRYATTVDGVRIALVSIGSGPGFVAVMPFPWSKLEGAWQLPEVRARFALMSAPTTGPVAISYAARRPHRVSHLILGG
jgi:hypothetical protein